MKIRTLLAALFSASLALAFAAPAMADDGPTVDFKGFFDVIAGRVLSSPKSTPDDFNPAIGCPCYLADWANGGIYDGAWSAQPESHIGIQADVKFTDKLSFTAQVTSHAVQPSPKLEWAYVTYEVAPDWEVQVGRKRIPLYYYSDFQDVGVAYPWITPPPELYGWEVTDYNGASVRYRGKIGSYRATASMFGGQENVYNDRYYVVSSPDSTNAGWHGIVGGDLEISKDWLTMRAVYVQANAFSIDAVDQSEIDAKVKTYGVAINADFDDWFVLSEFTEDDRTFSTNYKVKAPAYSVGAGYRYGAWTPFLNWGWYRESTSDSVQYPNPARYSRASLTVRYDWNATTAIKAQYDVYHEAAISDLTGNSRVFRVSFDKSF
jgi:hypothetical protein